MVAGQYCTFVVYTDGTVKACGKVNLYSFDGEHMYVEKRTDAALTPPPPPPPPPTHTHTHTHTHTQGSYGRLGLNNSDNQPTLKLITDFPTGTKIKKMATSRGSDGHSIAVNPEGHCYSWGDGGLINLVALSVFHAYVIHQIQYLM